MLALLLPLPPSWLLAPPEEGRASEEKGEGGYMLVCRNARPGHSAGRVCAFACSLTRVHCVFLE